MTAIDTHRASRAGYLAMVTHTFTIGTERKTARDMADYSHPETPHEHVTMTSSRSCAARKLARFLVGIGTPDGPIEAYGQDGRLRYRVNSLYAFAATTIRENPSLQRVPWHSVSSDTFSRTAGSEVSDDE